MRAYLMLASCALVVGCATYAKFEAKMNSFVGQPESAIVSRYGPPQGSYTMADGSKVLQYSKGGTVQMPGVTTYQPVTTNTTGSLNLYQGYQQTTGNYSSKSTTYVPQQAPPTTLNLWCTVNFTIDSSGTVRSWTSQGNHCVAQ